VVQALREVLLELLLDVLDLLVLLVFLELETIMQGLLQCQDVLLLDDAAFSEVLLVDVQTELAIPVKSQRIEPVSGELIGRLLDFGECVELLQDLVHDLVTAADVVNLSFAYVEIVLSLVDVLLIQVPEFELEVLSANRQGQISVIDVFVVNFFHHLARTSWNGEVIIDLEVAGVGYLLESLILMVIPRLEQVAQGSTTLITCLEELHNFLSDLLLHFGVEFLVIELEEVCQRVDAFKVAIEEAAEGQPVLVVLD